MNAIAFYNILYSGSAHNQMGVLAGTSESHLLAAFQYIFAFNTNTIFPTAENNLNKLYDSARVKVRVIVKSMDVLLTQQSSQGTPAIDASDAVTVERYIFHLFANLASGSG